MPKKFLKNKRPETDKQNANLKHNICVCQRVLPICTYALLILSVPLL